MITEEKAVQRLRIAAKTQTQAGLARQLAITPQYLNDVLCGRRSPAKVLARFGLRQVVRYEEKPA